MTIHLTFDDPTPPPCIGQGDLFTSPLQADHALAAVHCNKGRKLRPNEPECPFLVACHQRLTDEIAASVGANSSVEGTWAGELIGAHGKPGRPKKAAA